MKTAIIKIPLLLGLSCIFLFLARSDTKAWGSEQLVIETPSASETIISAEKVFTDVYLSVNTSNGAAPQELKLAFSPDKTNWTVPDSVHFVDPNEAGAQADGSLVSELLTLKSEYKHIKIISAEFVNIKKLKFDLLNTKTSENFSTSAADSFPLGSVNIVSRAGWGCPDNDTNSNYYCNGPFWDPDYATTTHIVVHHTATSNSASDWPAVVRAIWYDHSHIRDADPNDGVQGWTDIGYHYLIDPNGVVYEGRYGQRTAPSGQSVRAGHTLNHNAGTIGISMLGDFTNTNITAAARTTLTNLVQELLNKYNLDPLANKTDAGGFTRRVITGHRDWNATQCPGQTFYNTISSLPVVAPAPANTAIVYRFLNKISKVHFYTANPSERAFVINNLGSIWENEGAAYKVPTANVSGAVPVHRFLHKDLKIHFYTANEPEKNFVQTQLGSIWQYEGVVFYSHSSSALGRQPVHRFLHKQLKIHFYTANTLEKYFVQESLSTIWQYEGVAFYGIAEGPISGVTQVAANCPISTQACVPCTAGDPLCRIESGKSSGFQGWACQNNNPGNIRYSTARNALISVQSAEPACGDRGGYMVFSTYTAGREGLKAYIKSISEGRHSAYPTCASGNCNLRYFFSIYAPAGDQNDPDSYSSNVANWIGVNPDTTMLGWIMQNKFEQFIDAIQRQEGFFTTD